MARRYANPQEVDLVRSLIGWGLNNCQINRATGVSRATIRDWRSRPPNWPRVRNIAAGGPLCPRCHHRSLDERAYAYLLGLYLGDGCISQMKNGVYKLRVYCADRWPGLIEECRRTIAAVRWKEKLPGWVQKVGCVEVYSSWNHWPCLFPQHGPGRKHERSIELAEWQRDIVRLHPEPLLRGLIHSDGCRVLNWVNGSAYSRYQFTNHSADIRAIFCWACDLYGVAWRVMRWQTISVARRPDVAKLDLVVGPKY
jgi:hypothetical protein